ncbi:hypothetical protein H8A87_15750 [Xenorhabdus sp. VLS]|uniref:Uncharacterized protein n=2 Tax=Xenorhabdus lircayensis TaxID=2763499 RepID=A0ABS0U9C7_9GAMM|nr:hypothetical protein [Xenorhabdus lircayensis]
MQEIKKVLVDSPAIAEDKLAVMMMYCFQLLSSTNADGVNMRVSDGRVLTLKFDENAIKH